MVVPVVEVEEEEWLDLMAEAGEGELAELQVRSGENGSGRAIRRTIQDGPVSTCGQWHLRWLLSLLRHWHRP